MAPPHDFQWLSSWGLEALNVLGVKPSFLAAPAEIESVGAPASISREGCPKEFGQRRPQLAGKVLVSTHSAERKRCITAAVPWIHSAHNSTPHRSYHHLTQLQTKTDELTGPLIESFVHRECVYWCIGWFIEPYTSVLETFKHPSSLFRPWLNRIVRETKRCLHLWKVRPWKTA